MSMLIDITIDKGKSFLKDMTILDENGAIVPLTGGTVTFYLRTKDNVAVLSRTLTLTSPTTGVCTLLLTTTDTGSLISDTIYRYELKLVLGSNTSRPVWGRAYVYADLST